MGNQTYCTTKTIYNTHRHLTDLSKQTLCTLSQLSNSPAPCLNTGQDWVITGSSSLCQCQFFLFKVGRSVVSPIVVSKAVTDEFLC